MVVKLNSIGVRKVVLRETRRKSRIYLSIVEHDHFYYHPEITYTEIT